MSQIFIGRVENNIIKIRGKDRFNKFLKNLEGKQIEIRIQELSKKRTINQNRYYWGVVLEMICNDVGYDHYELKESKEILHEYLVKRFLKVSNNSFSKTSKLSSKEFGKYLDSIKRWASQELNIYIPDPDESSGRSF